VRFDLTELARRARNPRRKSIAIRDAAPPTVLATNLYLAAYKPVVAQWTRYAERIAAEYERSLSAITTDAPIDIQALLDEAGSVLERLFIILDAALREWTLRVETWQRGKWRGAILSATGVDLQTVIGPEDVRETLESYLRWNTELVRDVSGQTRQRISNAVFAGLQNRTPAREVAAQIREATGLARDRSQRIAADQLSKLTGALADERRREAGLTTWEWRHSGKRHPRSWHVQRNGRYYSEDKAMIGKVVDGKTVEAPPSADDLPSRPPYCGCRSRSVLILD
jgi:predicted DCC family thiol-disulfide oxidoreductase YuxK